MPDLAAHREGKGLGLADVYAKTRISAKNLAALERGDFAALPPPVYTKAYIRQYAELVDIDPQVLLLKYDAFLKSQEDPRLARKSDDPGQSNQTRKLPKLLWMVLGVLVVIVAASFWLFSPSEKKPGSSSEETVAPTMRAQTSPAETATVNTAPVVQPAPPVAISEPITPVPTTPQPAAPVTITPPVPASPLPPPLPAAANTPTGVAPGSQKLAIKARETTWVAIRIDQQERRQVLLQPGETVTYTGNLFQVDVGNAGGIDVSLQGKPLPPLGEHGQVVHLTLP